MRSEHIVAKDYVGDRLSPAERKLAEAHLAGCSHCQGEVNAAKEAQVRLQANDTLREFTNFAFAILQGSASMLAPILRQAPFKLTVKSTEAEEIPGEPEANGSTEVEPSAAEEIGEGDVTAEASEVSQDSQGTPPR